MTIQLHINQIRLQYLEKTIDRGYAIFNFNQFAIISKVRNVSKQENVVEMVIFHLH